MFNVENEFINRMDTLNYAVQPRRVAPRLPPELVFEILTHLYYNEDGAVDQSSLAACTLVQSEWTEVAQQLLYREVTLSGYGPKHRSDIFHASIDPSTARGKLLGEFVRSIDIPVGYGDDAYSPTNFVALLRSCPRLYNLSISIMDMHEFEPKIVYELQELAQTTGPRIRSLRFRRSGVQSPVLYQLLSVWPSIQFLLVGLELAAAPPCGKPRFRLQELILHRNLLQDVLEWLLSSSADTLQLLDLRDLPGSRFATYLAKNHCHHIRSLRFIYSNNIALALIPRCLKLEEVIMHSLPNATWKLKFPPSLEHLSFRNPAFAKSPTLEHVLGIIPNLPKLRVITGDAGVRNHKDQRILQRLCEEQGVTLSFDGKPPWVLDDPVMPKRFPRGRSISNFPLMN
ncbi:hypothetical protein NEOLEDRAFT_1117999 [Neolentinus lepideus HHB14362 ss-1]|uniref:Uncharacterized protein n=1 Tax=Neolentinus lepideus HHB14362 ss-1 TaxID=1314782 RepID=A0A165R7T2_9AGAM|nr:hypothetical protein NEOLEDRAFT_1117999 [Neolentinus lepideus HHB14362 ss-1]